jgi:hypothetical protein
MFYICTVNNQINYGYQVQAEDWFGFQARKAGNIFNTGLPKNYHGKSTTAGIRR